MDFSEGWEKKSELRIFKWKSFIDNNSEQPKVMHGMSKCMSNMFRVLKCIFQCFMNVEAKSKILNESCKEWLEVKQNALNSFPK